VRVGFDAKLGRFWLITPDMMRPRGDRAEQLSRDDSVSPPQQPGVFHLRERGHPLGHRPTMPSVRAVLRRAVISVTG
jgi:hypothetical protein